MSEPYRRGMVSVQGDLDAILQDAKTIDDAMLGNIQLYNPMLGGLEIISHTGFGPSFLQLFRFVSPNDPCACARAFRQNERVLVPNVFSDPLFFRYRTIALRSGFQAVQSTPIRGARGQAIGVLSTHFPRPHVFSRHALGALDVYAEEAGSVIEGWLSGVKER